MEVIEYKGKWWKPENPEKSFSGLFQFDYENGGHLSIDGVLDGEKHDLIHGVATNGTPITLSDGFTTNQNTNWNHRTGEHQESKVFVHQLYVGAHITSFPPRFNKILFRTTLLDEWVNISGFNIQHDIQNHGVSIVYKTPPPIEVHSSETTQIKIVFQAKTPSLHFVQTSADISQKTFFEIEFNTLTEIDTSFNLIYKLQNFISLATLKPVVPLEVVGFSDDLTYEIGDKNLRQKFRSKIDIFRLPITKPINFNIIPPNMLFSYREIKDTLPQKIQRWFDKSDTLAPVFNLFFSEIYNPATYLERKFISAIQALEAYHRRTSANQELPLEQHKIRLDKILTAVPSELRNWVKGKLAYSNEPTLRMRLKQIYAEHNEILRNLMKEKEFVNLSVNTRNYHTHFDRSLENFIAKGRQLFWLTEVHKTILQLYILKELGFNESEICDLSKKFSIYKLDRKSLLDDPADKGNHKPSRTK